MAHAWRADGAAWARHWRIDGHDIDPLEHAVAFQFGEPAAEVAGEMSVLIVYRIADQAAQFGFTRWPAFDGHAAIRITLRGDAEQFHP